MKFAKKRKRRSVARARAKHHQARRGTTRRHVKRRRRSANPSPALMRVVMANPRRRRRQARRAHTAAPRRKFRMRHRRRSANPTRHAPRMRIVRRRRRVNPSRMQIGQIVRMGVAGLLGIVTARVAGKLYTRFVDEYVRGDEGRADSTHWRNWASELLRLVAMELAVYLGHLAADRAKAGSDMDRTAFFAAGTAETVRQTVGVGMKAFVPAARPWGFDGLAPGSPAPAGFVDGEGNVYALNEAGTQYELQGLADRATFDGLVARRGMAHAA